MDIHKRDKLVDKMLDSEGHRLDNVLDELDFDASRDKVLEEVSEEERLSVEDGVIVVDEVDVPELLYGGLGKEDIDYVLENGISHEVEKFVEDEEEVDDDVVVVLEARKMFEQDYELVEEEDGYDFSLAPARFVNLKENQNN